MKNIDKLTATNPFGLKYLYKKKIFLSRLKYLYNLHYLKSKDYRKLIDSRMIK